MGRTVRNINGIKFMGHKSCKTKTEAKTIANKLRGKGYSARVINDPSELYYNWRVFVHHKYYDEQKTRRLKGLKLSKKSR